MNLITSSSNPLIKQVKSLKYRKNREEADLFFIEGLRLVGEALKEKADIVKVLVSEQFAKDNDEKDILLQVEAGSYEAFVLPDRLFKEICDTEAPQGILAIVKMKPFCLDDILSGDNHIIMLDSLQDPGNMGTIIRTADAAGFSGVIVTKGCVDLYNPKVLRATMGSIFHMPLCFVEDALDALKLLKSRNIKVYAAHLSGSHNYFELDLKGNIVIIIGNEANGISEEIAASADRLVRIPMFGKAESLNASVAAGLLMYEVLRQRMAGL